MKKITKIEYEEDIDSVSIYVGANPYSIPMDRVKSQEALLGWILHLLKKGWMDRKSLRKFIEVTCEVKKWKPDMHA